MYLGDGTGVASLTRPPAERWVERAGTLRNLRGFTTATAGEAVTLTVYKNGAATALVAVLNGAAGGAWGADTVNTVAVVPGDLIAVHAIRTAGSGSKGVSTVQLELAE